MDDILLRAKELLLNDKNYLRVQYTTPVPHHSTGNYIELHERRNCANMLANMLQEKFKDAAEPYAFHTEPAPFRDGYQTNRLELYVMTRDQRTELAQIINTLYRKANMEFIDGP